MNEYEEQEFLRFLFESGADYEAAVRRNGNVPWFEDPEKLEKLGLSGLRGVEARRALFMRRYGA